MALIDYDLPVLTHEVLHAVFPNEALDHCDIQEAVAGLLAGADLTDRAGLESKEEGQLGDPLIEERSSVNSTSVLHPRSATRYVRPRSSRLPEVRRNPGLVF